MLTDPFHESKIPTSIQEMKVHKLTFCGADFDDGITPVTSRPCMQEMVKMYIICAHLTIDTDKGTRYAY